MDDEDKNFGRQVEKVKSGGNILVGEKSRSLRCIIDHSGSNINDQKGSKRLAALDLFDENDLKMKERSKHSIPLYNKCLLIWAEDAESQDNLHLGGEFWAQVYADQLGQKSKTMEP